MSAFVFYSAIICLLLGVGYPVAAILIYPLYKLFGGEQNFSEYVGCL